MATAIVLAAFFLLLLPLNATATDFFSPLSPLLSPVFDDVCKKVDCGKGNCKASDNSTFNFECECSPGWKQARPDDNDSLKFLPCVIPNCTLDYSCTEATISLHINHFSPLPFSSFHFKFPLQDSIIMFNPRTELASHPAQSFGTWGDLSFGSNNQKMGQNYDQSCRNNWNSCGGGGGGGGVQFRLETMEEDSGVCSPPLWGTTSPPRSQSPVQSRQNLSRKQAIAKGQSELMEMVKNMPESCYELSLKDIVEHNYNQTRSGPDQEDFSMNSNEEKAILGGGKRRKNDEQNNKVLRSKSIDQNKRGMLLKMGFVPFSFIGSSKKKKCCVANKINTTCAKVSPKPEFCDKSSPKSVDQKDWWMKRLAVSGDSESGGDSSHSGGSSGSSGSSLSNSSSHSRSVIDRNASRCWPIFLSKKSKNAR